MDSSLEVSINKKGKQVVFRVKVPKIKIHYSFSWRRTLKSETIFGNWKPFKNDEKYFLLHLKSSSFSLDIQIFVLNFWSCRKTAWSERYGLWRYNLVKKQAQYTYWLISQEVKKIYLAVKFGQLKVHSCRYENLVTHSSLCKK